MSLYHEISFETEICDHLAANGWLYEPGDTKNYGRASALFPVRQRYAGVARHARK